MNHPYSKPGRRPLKRIPLKFVEQMVGRRVHLAGAERGRNYTLVQIDGDEAVLSTGYGEGRTLTYRRAPIGDLLFSRAQAVEYNKLRKEVLK